jgi:hypothetical protein
MLSIRNYLKTAIAIFGAIGLLTAPALAQSYEVHSVRSAAKILPPDLRQGKHFKVRDQVLAYDFLHHYTVESDFGTFEVTGDGALRKLVREIAAIAALKDTKTIEAVGESVKKAATSPFVLAKNLVTSPVDTVSGLPKGVGRIFGNVAEGVTMEHDPSEDAKIKQALFVSSWKRDFAAENGVDVYSSNKVLQKELNRVGWAAAISGLSISVATMAGGTAVTVMKNMRLADQVGNALKEEPPSRLRLINEKKLKEMGVSDTLTQRYLDHLAFTPRHDTIIVESLAQMKLTRGRAAFVKHILSAEDEVGANFFQQMAETMLGYHTTVSSLDEIAIVDGMVVAQAKNGTTFVPFPLDRGVWTARAKGIFENIKANRRAAGFKEIIDLWVTGTVSPLARQQLAARNVTVTENVDERIGFLN